MINPSIDPLKSFRILQVYQLLASYLLVISKPKGAAVLKRSALWLDEVDEIDFDQLQHVLYLAYWLGAEDEDVAISALAAIERFTLYRSLESPYTHENH